MRTTHEETKQRWGEPPVSSARADLVRSWSRKQAADMLPPRRRHYACAHPPEPPHVTTPPHSHAPHTEPRHGPALLAANTRGALWYFYTRR
jgi:hypothetical protein